MATAEHLEPRGLSYHNAQRTSHQKDLEGQGGVCKLGTGYSAATLFAQSPTVTAGISAGASITQASHPSCGIFKANSMASGQVGGTWRMENCFVSEYKLNKVF